MRPARSPDACGECTRRFLACQLKVLGRAFARRPAAGRARGMRGPRVARADWALRFMPASSARGSCSRFVLAVRVRGLYLRFARPVIDWKSAGSAVDCDRCRIEFVVERALFVAGD